MPARLGTLAAVAALALAANVAQAAHPSLTEDTGTQGAGHGELELGMSILRPPGGRIVDFEPQLSFGVGERVDAIVRPTVLWIRAREDSAHGLGATTTDVKWRFAELDLVSMGLRAGIDWPTGSGPLGGRRPSLHGLLVVTRTLGDGSASLDFGVDRRGRTDGERRTVLQAAAGVAYPVAPDFTMVADLALQSNPDATRATAQVAASLGVIVRLAPWLAVDVGYRFALNDVARPQALLAGATFRW